MKSWRVAAGAIAVAVAASGGCDFTSSIADYCRVTGACFCDGGFCCVTPGNACDDQNPCCGAQACIDGFCFVATPDSGTTDSGTTDAGTDSGVACIPSGNPCVTSAPCCSATCGNAGNCCSPFSGLCSVNSDCCDTGAQCDATGHCQPPSGFDAGPPPVALVIVGAAQTVTQGTCSGNVTVQQVQADGGPAPAVLGPVTVNVATDGGAGVTVYGGASCSGGSTSTLTIPVNQSTTSFDFTAANVGTVGFTVTATGLASATQTETVVAAGTPALVILPGTFTAAAGGCAGAFQVVSVSSDGGALPLGAGGLAVTVTATAVSGTVPTLFPLASCSGAGGNPLTIAIPAGSSDAGFTLSGCPAGSFSLDAHATNGTYTDGTASVTLTAAPARLSYTTPPQTVTAGYCSGQVGAASAVQFELLDACGNPTNGNGLGVSLTSPLSALTFYTDNACMTAPVSSLSVVGSADSFYFVGQTPGTYDAGISATGAAGAGQNETISACVALSQSCAGGQLCCIGSRCNAMNSQCCHDPGGTCAQVSDCCMGSSAPEACDAGKCCVPAGFGDRGSAGNCCDGMANAATCCKANGVSCGGNGECCGGLCSSGTCGPPACPGPGMGCGGAALCCPGLTCQASACCVNSNGLVPVGMCSLCCSLMCQSGVTMCPDGGLNCQPCM